MTVLELIEKLKKLNPNKEIENGYDPGATIVIEDKEEVYKIW